MQFGVKTQYIRILFRKFHKETNYVIDEKEQEGEWTNKATAYKINKMTHVQNNT